ncbi:MAG: putative porin [Opitutaceae bacterium]|nr:putative porin [Opitutaceae bacterium]
MRAPFARCAIRALGGLAAQLALAAGVVAADLPSIEERLRRLEAVVGELREENAALRRELGQGAPAVARADKPVAPVAAPSVPSVRLSGDIRFRFASTMYRAPEAATRDQLYTQLRVGFLATPGGGFEAGLRFSAGDLNPNFGGTPGSAQFSAGDNGSKKHVFVDQAFVRWRPSLGGDAKAAFTFGKSENLFFVPSRLLFDSDYTPEGFTQEVTLPLSGRHRAWLAAGQYMLDEISASARDPWLIAARARLTSQWHEAWWSVFGAGWLGVTHAEQLTAANVGNINRGNTRTRAGVLTHGYRPFYAEAAVTRLFDRGPGYAGKFPVTFSADLLHNPAAPAQNDAWSAGVTIGKAGKAGQWEIGYRRHWIEADAWWEEPLDGDYGAYYRSVPPGWNTDAASTAGAHGSGTNLRNHSIRTSWSPQDYLLFTANLFLNDLIKKVPSGAIDTAGKRVQVEGTVRF